MLNFVEIIKIMKTAVYSLMFICVASFLFMGGCLKNIVSVKFDYQSQASFLSDSLTTTGDQVYGSSVIVSDLSAELDKNGATLDMLDDLKLKTATVAFTSPDSIKNFDWVESFELWVSADGKDPLRVASKNPVATGLTSVSLDVNKNENLMNYFKAPSVKYEVRGRNKAPLLPMDLNVTATYEVKASSK